MDKATEQPTEILSPEQKAQACCEGFRGVVVDHWNHVEGAKTPEDYLREHLAGMDKSEAMLAGFRLAQSMRKTPAGDLQATVAHSIGAVLQRDAEARDESPLLCSRCGGKNVHTVAWVDAQTNEVLDDFGSFGELDTSYCVDCEDGHGLTSDPDDVRGVDDEEGDEEEED